MPAASLLLWPSTVLLPFPFAPNILLLLRPSAAILKSCGVRQRKNIRRPNVLNQRYFGVSDRPPRGLAPARQPLYDASARWAGALWHVGTQERHDFVHPEGHVCQADLTLIDATLLPLLLEIRGVSLLPLCFHGCFNALRLSVMSS